MPGPAVVAPPSASEGAWIVFGSTLSASSGSFGNATLTLRYKKVGRIVSVNIGIAIPGNGTAAGFVGVTLPFNAATSTCIAGRDATLNAKAAVGNVAAGTNTLAITAYDGTYPAASGTTLVLNGSYEATT